ncbi:MAG: hypothetical protein PGN29_01205 [Gordonia paraffinivorans]
MSTPATRDSRPQPAMTSQTTHGTDVHVGPSHTAATAMTTAWRWISFVLGCVLLVLCAWALSTRLQQWSHDYGGILVFLVFFLIMSIAGRWFWAGIDAALGRVIQGRAR